MIISTSYNVEGLCRVKCTYLEGISKDYKVNILCLQETHIPEGAPPDRLRIQGFQLSCHDTQTKYGTAIYLREDISRYAIISPTKINATSTIGVNVGGLSIYHTYKPPDTIWVH